MDTTALDTDQAYRRVIEARFVARQDGTPMHCTTCNTVLVAGQTAAAVTPDRRWDSYCAECAAVPAAQVRGLVKQVTEMGITLDDGTLDVVRTFLTAQGTAVPAALSAAKSVLFTIRDGAAKAARFVALQADPVWIALALATTPGLLSERDRSFAESLATQWETKGSLSVKQMPYAIKLGEQARKADAKGTVRKDWTVEISDAIHGAGMIDGYYAVDHVGTVAHQDTTFVRVLTADDGSGTHYMRHIVGGKGETPSGGAEWCRKVIALVYAAGIEESMRRYGREINRCCKCHRTLTDKPSRDAGIGPVCVLTGF